jgi:hypothetical protein
MVNINLDLKEKICEACDSKCQHYINGKISFHPLRLRRVWANIEKKLYPKQWYSSCIHYDLIRKMRAEVADTSEYL